MGKAAFFLKHDFVGKSTHEPGTARAHARYMMRGSASVRQFGRHMPSDYWDILDVITAREQSIRKNGRVLDKFIINLPYALSVDQSEAALRNLLDTVTQGRVPYHVSIHGDTKAPHAHVILIDADVETGKRVVRTTDAGSSHKIKKVWESSINDALRIAGISQRVSRWGKYSAHYHELNANLRPVYSPPVQGIPMSPQSRNTKLSYDTIMDAHQRLSEVQHDLAQAQKAEADLADARNRLEKNAADMEKAEEALKLAAASSDRAIAGLDKHKVWLLMAPLLRPLGLFHRRIKQADAARRIADSAQMRVNVEERKLADLQASTARIQHFHDFVTKDVELYQARLASYGRREDIKSIMASHRAAIEYHINLLDDKQLTKEQKVFIARVHAHHFGQTVTQGMVIH